MTELNVHIKFIEDVLGTSSNDKEIYSNYIASKSPDPNTIEDEVAAVGVNEVFEKGTTVFPRLSDGSPFIYDYQWKGFFKDACGMLTKVVPKDPETGKKCKAVNESGKISCYKKVIDGLIFVYPRKIPINLAGDITICQRPLRAQTAQGERIALASSESVPAGSEVYFKIMCMNDIHEAAVVEWLNYGYWRGFGQWRNSSKGRFCYEVIGKNGKVLYGNMDLAEEYMSA